MAGLVRENTVDAGEPGWFAVMVKTRYERTVGKILEQAGYDVLVPTYRVRKLRGGRYRAHESVLFPSYVFCRFVERKRLPILMTPGVTTIVGTSAGPSRLREEEIEALRSVVRANVDCQPWPWVRIGQPVEITHGPLKGIKGSIINVGDGYRLILNVTGLHRSVAVRLDRESVTPVATDEALPLDNMYQR